MSDLLQPQPGPEPSGLLTAGNGSGGSRSLGWIALKLAVLGLAVFLVVRLAGTVGWSELAERLQTATAAPVAIAFCCLVGRFLAWQQRWFLALRETGTRAPFWRRFAALTSSILVNHITPTVRILGGVVRARYLATKEEYSFARVYGAVLFDQVAHHTVIGVITWMSFIAFSWAIGRRELAWIALILIPLLVLILVLRSRGGESSPQRKVARSLTRRVRTRSRRFDLFLDRGRQTVRTLTELLKRPQLLVMAGMLSLAIFALNVTAQTLLFHAVGARIAVWQVAVMVALGAIAGAMTGTPGGIGSTEAAMIAGFAALGVGRIDAVAAALLYRGLHYLAVVGCGLPSLIWLELGRRRATPGP